MSSNLKVNTILPSTGTTIGIGTVGGLINVVGNIDVNSTSGISTFNGLEISGIVTAKAGAAVTYYGDGSNLTGITDNVVTINNNANNRVITGSGSANTLEGEANLTFNGTTLDVTGNYSVKNPSDASYITHTFASNFAKIDVRGTNIANSNHYLIGYGAGHGSANDFHIVNTVGDLVLRNGNGNALEVDSNRNLKATAGNFVVGTAGKGIDFSATSDYTGAGSGTPSELLDEYEEGTFTPRFQTSNGNWGGSMSSQNGSYTRIGNFVHVRFRIHWGSVSGSGTFRVTALPFTVANTASNEGGGATIGWRSGFNYPRLTSFFRLNTQLLQFGYVDASGSFGSFDLSVGAIASTGYAYCSGSYEVA